jgi:hypothetical protein
MGHLLSGSAASLRFDICSISGKSANTAKRDKRLYYADETFVCFLERHHFLVRERWGQDGFRVCKYTQRKYSLAEMALPHRNRDRGHATIVI